MGGMTNLEHKNYGAMGSEFILHHYTLHPKRLLASFIIVTSLSLTFKLHEMNILLLWLMSAVLAVLLVIKMFNKVSKEVLLVLPSVGVQVKTHYWFGRQETMFFDKSRVKGIVINEAITMQSVLCYLAVLLTSSPAGPTETVVPLFTRSWPSLKDLVYVYRTVENKYSCCFQSSVHPDFSREEQAVQLGAGDTTDTKPEGTLLSKLEQVSLGTRKRTRFKKS